MEDVIIVFNKIVLYLIVKLLYVKLNGNERVVFEVKLRFLLIWDFRVWFKFGEFDIFKDVICVLFVVM